MESKLSFPQKLQFAIHETFRPDGFSLRKRRLANLIYSSDSIKLGEFSWKAHTQQQATVPAPLYTDLRDLLRGNDTARRLAVKEYKKLVRRIPLERKPNAVADVPLGSTPGAVLLADRLRLPLLTARLDNKQHGTGAKINGLLKSNVNFLHPVVIEDVVSFGISSGVIIDAHRQNGLQVTDIVAILDNEVGAKERFALQNIHLQTVFTISQILDYGVRRGFITESEKQRAREGLTQLRENAKNKR